MTTRLILGDCLEVMKTLPDASVDAIVTNPPSGIAFMNMKWDSQRTRERFVDFLSPRLAEARRVSMPGSYMLCWALPRTSHWTGLAIEDAGWVVRDRVAHLFGTGFPKGKSCLKPAREDWWLAWNPAKKVTPLNIDACRIGLSDGDDPRLGGNGTWKTTVPQTIYGGGSGIPRGEVGSSPLGRWPANLTHDGSPEVMEAFAAFGETRPGHRPRTRETEPGSGRTMGTNWNGPKVTGDSENNGFGDSGSAARFFYCAKASKTDRGDNNTHPTVKSTELMRWLCRMITPPGGTILDLFTGSGSTGKAAVIEGFDFIGIEQKNEYFAISERRIAEVSPETFVQNSVISPINPTATGENPVNDDPQQSSFSFG